MARGGRGYNPRSQPTGTLGPTGPGVCTGYSECQTCSSTGEIFCTIAACGGAAGFQGCTMTFDPIGDCNAACPGMGINKPGSTRRRGGRTRLSPKRMARGGAARRPVRKMGAGGNCGGSGQPPCGGMRKGGRTRPQPRGRGRRMQGGGGNLHSHPFSTNVQKHWGQYPGGHRRGTKGYSHSHMKRGGRTRPVTRGRGRQMARGGRFQVGGPGGQCPAGTDRTADGRCTPMGS